MYRKRLLGMFTAMLLGLSAGPAAAMTIVSDGPVDTVAPAKAFVEHANVDPEVDESIPGVGRVLVDIDEEEQTLTIGIGIEPLGVDETVTLSAGGGDDEEEAPEGPSEAEQAAVEHRAEMDAAKAAAAEKMARTPRPAFSANADLENVSGSVSSGSGVTSSVRPAASVSEGTNALPILPDAAANPWVQLMGVVMLAGTSTAWSIAKREGLA